MENNVIGVTAKSFLANKTLVTELKKTFPDFEILTTGTDQEILEKSRYALVGREPINAHTLPPRLRTIIKYGVGLDNIDLDYCSKNNASVYYAPGVNRDEVVEQTLGFMIGLSRNLHRANTEMHQGGWIKDGGRSLSELTVGIIGAGSIGGKLAELLATIFRPKLMICDIVDKSHMAQNWNTRLASLEECLAACDLITFHVPLTSQTRDLVSDRHLAMMKPGLMLVNTSRGEVISETALIRGLEQKIIAGAALDVFHEEPLAQDSKLRSFKQVILSPHTSGNSHAAVLKMGRAAIELLKSAILSSRES
ncbi:MAG: NAD(P)-dependent oxidoreductase [Pseudomonadota bacterium]